MKEITEEQLKHLPDPISRLTWIRWINRGEARLIKQGEITCPTEAQVKAQS
jgi:hypothetical protein